MTFFIIRMPNIVKESDGDENCDKKGQQPTSSKGKGQKTLAVKTRQSPPPGRGYKRKKAVPVVRRGSNQRHPMLSP